MVQQTEANNQNNTQTPARNLPPKKQIYVQALLSHHWTKGLKSTKRKVRVKQNYKHWQLISILNPFPQSTLDQHYTVNVSTVSKLVSFTFCFQAATIARPSPL